MWPFIPLFWTSGFWTSGLKARVGRLIHNWQRRIFVTHSLRVASGVTPADHLVASIAVEPLSQGFPHALDNTRMPELPTSFRLAIRNVFIGVCHFFCRQGVCVPQHAMGKGVYTPVGTHPSRQTLLHPPTRWPLQWTVRILLQ